jgi:hypothetical protein
MTRLTFQRLQVRNPKPDQPHVHTVPVGNGNPLSDVSAASHIDDQGVSVASRNGSRDVSDPSHCFGCGWSRQLAGITREFDCGEPMSARDQRTVFKVPVSKIQIAIEGGLILNASVCRTGAGLRASVQRSGRDHRRELRTRGISSRRLPDTLRDGCTTRCVWPS